MKLMTLFSGAGFVESGAEALGAQTVGGVESCARTASIWRDNHQGFLWERDLTHYTPITVFPFREGFDILWASPPCQRYSLRNIPTHRDEHLEAIEPWLNAYVPAYFFLECSPRIRGMRKRSKPAHSGYRGRVCDGTFVPNPAYKRLLQRLHQLGYFVREEVVDFADYGLPSNRKRLMLIASQSARYTFPTPKPRGGWREVIDASCLFQSDWAPSIRPAFKYAYASCDTDVLLVDTQYANRVDGRTVTVRLPHEPAFTLTAAHARRHIYCLWYGVEYRLNFKGYTRLMGIADSFILNPPRYISLKAVGNGVPPVIAKDVLAGTL